jgi:hypothetical protein
MENKIIVSVKNVYGLNMFYPVNDQANKLLKLVNNKKTLTNENLIIAKAIEKPI